MEPIRLEDDRWCFACGERNPSGLRLDFRLGDDRVLRTAFTFRREHQGYAGIVHGGLVGLILDETMVNLAWRLGHPAVTAALELRFRKAALVGEEIRFEGRLAGVAGRLVRAEAEARDRAGDLVAAARAKCLIVRGPAGGGGR
ncbi:MAG: PaaI family thioesterase [bacterium]|nr:PaaI family thioesterase [bacterium]